MRYLPAIVWVLLALTTLYLVVQTDNTLAAALVAWTGGVLTHILGHQLYLRKDAQ